MATTTGSTLEEVSHTDLVFEPEEEDGLYLQLKSKATMRVNGKRDILVAFSKKDPTVIFDKNFSRRPDVQGLFSFFDADKKNCKRWTASVCARKLWVIHKLLRKWDEEVQNRRRSGRESTRAVQDDDMKALNKLIKECEKRTLAESERNKNGPPRVRTETNIQEKNPFDEKRRDSRPCPYCKHDVLMPIETSQEIEAENKRIRGDHEQKMKEWNCIARESRPPKPRMKKTVCLTLACYCARQNCLMRSNGEGCVTCKSFSDQGLREHLVAVVDLDGGGPNDMKCPCKVCQCGCQKSFSSHLYGTIAFDLEAKKMGVTNADSAARLDVGKLIASQLDNARVQVIQDGGSEKYLGLDPEKSREAFNQDTLAYASLALASDPILHSNVEHRKRLQEAIGPRSNREVRIFLSYLFRSYCEMPLTLCFLI